MTDDERDALCADAAALTNWPCRNGGPVASPYQLVEVREGTYSLWVTAVKAVSVEEARLDQQQVAQQAPSQAVGSLETAFPLRTAWFRTVPFRAELPWRTVFVLSGAVS
jgi:hypothetical protein